MSQHTVQQKFYIDENLPAPISTCLHALFRGAVFHSSHTVGTMDGTKDIPLLRYLAEEGYGYFITQDLKQMTIPQERNAVKASGMSWIGVPHMERQVKGRQLIAAQVAVLAPVVGQLLK